MKKVSILLSLIIFTTLSAIAQVTTGEFGGAYEVGGVSNNSATQDKWIKLADMTLDGSYDGAGLTVDFFPKDANHGDSRQRLIVQMRNKNSGGLYQSTYDISIVHMSGGHFTIKDAKVVHTSGTGVTNNQLSVWVQMGISWLNKVPIEVRTYGNITVQTTPQPYYSSIQDAGTIYERNSYFAIHEGNMDFDGSVKSEEVVVDPAAWPDYVFEEGYDLQSLEEVEAYIKANGHLPNIMPADTAMANGVALGEMNVKLLEKIEELTLHTIDQNKQIKAQQDLITKQAQKEAAQQAQLEEQSALLKQLMERVAKLEQ